MTSDVASPRERTSASSWYGLAVLSLVTVFAYVDRQVLVLLAEPLKRELKLSDVQLGLLQGLGVSAFSALAVYPLGWLSDRIDRRVVIAICVTIWSAAVVGCGLAATFPQLFLMGAVVGAGEAGLSPTTLAMLPELFRRRLQLANSIYSVATVLGPALAAVLCGYIVLAVEHVRPGLSALAQLSSWRLTLLVAAAPAPLFLVLLALLPSSRRGPSADRSKSNAGAGLRSYIRVNRLSFYSFAFGMAAAFFGFSALMSWIPVAAVREYGASPSQVGMLLGLATVVAIGFAFLVTTVLGVRLQAWLGVATPVRVLSFAGLTGWTALAALPFLHGAEQLMAGFGIFLCVMMTAQMYFPTAIQALAPSALRGRVIALVRVLYWCGGAASPPIVGWLSDRFAPSGLRLIDATVAVASFGLVVSGLFFLACARAFPETARVARQADGSRTGVFVAGATHSDRG